jgi:hypothetical protein
VSDPSAHREALSTSLSTARSLSISICSKLSFVISSLKPYAQRPRPAATRRLACPSSPCSRANSRLCRLRTRWSCPVKRVRIGMVRKRESNEGK